MITLAIVGSRSFASSALVEEYIEARFEGNYIGVVSGGAAGVDSWAAAAARKLGLPLEEFLPDYETHGRRAPLVRNTLIVDACDELVAFWDGQSRGTLDSIRKAVKAGKLVTIIGEGYGR